MGRSLIFLSASPAKEANHFNVPGEKQHTAERGHRSQPDFSCASLAKEAGHFKGTLRQGVFAFNSSGSGCAYIGGAPQRLCDHGLLHNKIEKGAKQYATPLLPRWSVFYRPCQRSN